MKNLLSAAFAVAMLCHASAQTPAQTPYLWPIKDAKAGEGIIYAPQSYIDKELNSSSLYITAREGSVVVSPADGTITNHSMIYIPRLSVSNAWKMSERQSFDARKADIIANGEYDETIDPRYIVGDLTIRAADGATITISGLSGDEIFKTGQRIERGTPIGRVARVYHKIEEPAIDVSIAKGDPMTPFGLKTTYVAPEAIKPVVSLTKEQAAEDFTVYIDALKECFMGLYNVITPEELEEYVGRTLVGIRSHEGDISYKDFRGIITSSTVKIHDNHIAVMPAKWRLESSNIKAAPGIAFGFFSDTLRVSNASERLDHLMGRRIASVNGIPADSIRQVILSTVGDYDASTESFKQYRLATIRGFIEFIDPAKGYVNPEMDLKVTFADGEQMDIPGTERMEWIHLGDKFPTLNQYRAGFEAKMLNDSTAYLGIATFGLNEVQIGEIGAFIASISKAGVPNIIIDVRNNGGGHGDVTYRLFSYIAGEPMTLQQYNLVGSNSTYKTFAHALNRPPEDEPFPEYKPETGKAGYYQRSENIVKPDPQINYKGRIYMLTNENSASAATMFPALFVRNGRGVTVGRETRCAYHFMNAMKSVNVRLPWSQIEVWLPLVEAHFDSVITERTPYGRGVMPDYPVPLSLEEILSEGDTMLEYTLGLIKRGSYFP